MFIMITMFGLSLWLKLNNNFTKCSREKGAIWLQHLFGFVALSICPFCPDFPLYLNNYFIKRIYMHIIKTASMRGLRLCALFVVSTYISRLIDENVRKKAKTKILKYKFMRKMIYHLVVHKILRKTVYFIYHFNVCFSRNWRKCSQNLEKWKLKNSNLWRKWYIIL